jgi:hypothetical protein
MKTPNLNSKLLQFQSKVNAIKKDGKNPHFKSSYTTLNDILAEVKPLLSELGLIILQPINHDLVTTVITCAETGESVSSSISMPSGLNPQQLGSAVTYFRRYNISSLLALESTDDDGNDASVKPKQESKPMLTPETLKKMITAIQEGKSDKVKEAMENYTISGPQSNVLKLALINV